MYVGCVCDQTYTHLIVINVLTVISHCMIVVVHVTRPTYLVNVCMDVYAEVYITFLKHISHDELLSNRGYYIWKKIPATAKRAEL